MRPVGPSHGDEYSGLAALLFLSALASYLPIRLSHRRAMSVWCERIADLCFVAGFINLALIGLSFAYEVI